jgi:hypothetical protein
MRTHNFFNTSDRDFYSKKNSISQVYTYLPELQKNLKNTTIVDAYCALYVQSQMLLHICHLFFQIT